MIFDKYKVHQHRSEHTGDVDRTITYKWERGFWFIDDSRTGVFGVGITKRTARNDLVRSLRALRIDIINNRQLDGHDMSLIVEINAALRFFTGSC